MRDWRNAIVVFALIALALTAHGLLPHRVMIPLDLPRDFGAWKPDPNQRVAVSNRLLSDAVLEFRAWDFEIRRLVRKGEFPWRNRFAGNGAQLFANPESGLLFPLVWLRVAMQDRGWAVYGFLKLFLAGLGMWWFARVSTGRGGRVALLSGFVYMTCGYMTVWLLSPHTSVYAMLPWLGASALSLIRRPTRARAAATIVCAALATAGGHPETLFYGVTSIAIFIAWTERRRLALAAACALIGFALCAVQLVPFARAATRSDLLAQRGHRLTNVRFFAIPATILPGFLGTPLGSEIDLSGISPSAENFAERSGGYVGAVVLLMALSAWRRHGLIIGLAALLLSWLPIPFFGAPERLGLVFAFWSAAALPPLLQKF